MSLVTGLGVTGTGGVATAVVDPPAAELTIVSMASDGSPAGANSDSPSVSGDGRFVAFQSLADNLVPGDSFNTLDVFVRDRVSGVTELVSAAPAGGPANGGSDSPAISADGRYIAFASFATDLVSTATNRRRNVYVRDRVSGVTELVSVAPDGMSGNGYSSVPSISADGRYIAFESLATNLVTGGTDGAGNVFVRDRDAGVTELVSVALDGTAGNWFSGAPSISADGRFIAFLSSASDLVSGATSRGSDVYLRDRMSGVTELISVAPDGTPANDSYYGSFGASVTADGRFVVFHSYATNLVAADTDAFSPDVFVRDRQSGVTELVSVTPDGTPGNGHSYNASVSADGRFVAFESSASDLVPDDTNGNRDVFVRDRQSAETDVVSVAPDGSPGTWFSEDPAISVDGRFIAFSSAAPNLVADDTNGRVDVFLADLGSAMDAVRSVILALPEASLESRGHRTAMLSMLHDVQSYLDAGERQEAERLVSRLVAKVDGCGQRPDNNDWVVSCTDQVAVRDALEHLRDGIARP